MAVWVDRCIVPQVGVVKKDYRRRRSDRWTRRKRSSRTGACAGRRSDWATVALDLHPDAYAPVCLYALPLCRSSCNQGSKPVK